jgi:heme exporter protein CcmD
MSLLDLPHIGYVIVAYAITFTAIAVLIGATVFDYRTLRRSLAAHESAGASHSELEAAPE